MKYTADEMIERERQRGAIVLFDTCISDPPGDDYNFTDAVDIRNLIKYKGEFIDFVSRGDFYTSPEVVEEMWRFSNAVRKYMRHLDATREKEFEIYKKWYGNHENHGKADDITGAKRMFSIAVDIARRLHKATEERVYVVTNHATYERIVEGVIELDERSHLKKDSVSKYEDMHTDERLVALGIYLSTVENMGSAILTSDRDILRLMKASVNALIKNEDLLLRDHCRKAFSLASPRIYMKRGSEYVFADEDDANSGLGRDATEEIVADAVN